MLKVNDVTIEYPDGARAIDSVSFSIAAGENVALIGANGAGKTTLLLSLVGVLLPKSGEIAFTGRAAATGGAATGDAATGGAGSAGSGFSHTQTAAEAAPRTDDGRVAIITNRTDKETLRRIRAGVGLVFQNPDDQLFMPNIYEDVAFGPRSFGCDEAETEKHVSGALSRLGIGHLEKRSPLKLSGGEKRLAAIATVLSMEPDVLLFDEPTAFLDPRAKRNLAAILSDLPQGKLIATHDLMFAEEVCSRVILLQNGKLIEDGGKSILLDSEKLKAAGL